MTWPRCSCGVLSAPIHRHCPSCGQRRDRRPLSALAGGLILCLGLVAARPTLNDAATEAHAAVRGQGGGPQAGSRGLPPGHPVTGTRSMAAGLPAGHPVVGGAGADRQKPADHPVVTGKRGSSLDPVAADLDKVDALLADAGNNDAGRRNLARALTLLDDMLRRYPRHGYALRLKAHLHRDLHQTPAAVSAYRAYLALRPDDYRTTLAYAAMLWRAGDADAAQAVVGPLVEAAPRYAEALDLAASVAEALGRAETAADYRARRKRLVAEHQALRPPVHYLPRLPEGD